MINNKKFLSKSVAYAAMIESVISAVIVGTARYQDVIPIDIETKVEHRKKDLASTLTQYFVNECIEKGFVAQWNCIESNIAWRL